MGAVSELGACECLVGQDPARTGGGGSDVGLTVPALAVCGGSSSASQVLGVVVLWLGSPTLWFWCNVLSLGLLYAVFRGPLGVLWGRAGGRDAGLALPPLAVCGGSSSASQVRGLLVLWLGCT